MEVGLIQKFLRLLSQNPDALAKKFRILKLDLLGLKRNDDFDVNKYQKFYIPSPATLIAKKIFLRDNGVDVKANPKLLYLTWKKIIKRINDTLSDEEADIEGKRLTLPYKKRYDVWMGEYKKWCHDFYRRRGRRIIIKV